MRLTRKRAILLSIELWTWLAETGEEKEDWPGWKINGGQHSDIAEGCFLCEYTDGREIGYSSCASCPYFATYGDCGNRDNPFHKWYVTKTVAGRKRYAQEFLEELKKLGGVK